MDATKAERLRRLREELGAARGDLRGLLGDKEPASRPTEAAPTAPAPPAPKPVAPPAGPGPLGIERALARAAGSLSLANLSHELRTPLNGILGMVESLAGTRLDEAQRAALDILRDSAEALLATIGNLLDHVELETEGLRLAEDAVSLRPLVAGIERATRRHAEDKGLALHVELDPSLPHALRGDGERLRQILGHLLGNAVKFTAKGEVRLRLREMGRDGNLVRLRVEVSDTGVGIPPEERERLFAPFTQLDSSSRRPFGGAGLGLSISRRLVEQMGGEIEVVSAVGEGTEFRVTLALPALADPAPSSPAAAASERRGRVLVVDDNGTNRKVASAILGKLGHQAVAVDSGEAALAALREEPFDLVLMDIQMPGMDGMEATRAIRAPGSGVLDRDIAILALTAHTGQDDRRRFLEAGMNDHLPKPAQPAMIQAALERWLPGAGEPPTVEEEAQLPVFDRTATLERVGGDEALMAEVIAIFLDETPADLETLDRARAAGDQPTLQRAAHTIKGAARNVGALRLGELAYEVEMAARQGALAGLEEAVEGLRAALGEYRQSAQS